MEFPYVIANAFAKPGADHTGNPAAVVFLDERGESVGDDVLQGVATTINLSETAFVSFITDAREEWVDYSIRWFTPSQEIDFCGHASLAAAKVILTYRHSGRNRVRFTFGAGVANANELIVTHDDETDGQYTMEASTSAPSAIVDEVNAVKTIREAFEETTCAAATFSASRNSIGDTFLLINTTGTRDECFYECFNAYFDSERAPDMAKIASIGGRGVSVVLPAYGRPNRDYDFYTRWFGPRVGIPEDPATGSACCGIAPLLTSTFGVEPGCWIRGAQLSRERGDLRLRLARDDVALTHVSAIVRLRFRGEVIVTVDAKSKAFRDERRAIVDA